MFRRKVISSLLLLVCAVSACVNGLGVLMCDCASHRSCQCCAHTDGDHACRHDDCHGDCNCPTAVSGGAAGVSRSCDCNHSHDGGSVYTADSAHDRILQLLKNGAAGLPHSCRFDLRSPHTLHTQFVCRASVCTDTSPDLSSGAPRAPSA